MLSEAERQAHLVLMAKTDTTNNYEDSDSDDEANPSYHKLFDKYDKMLGEFEFAKLTDNYKLL